MAKRSRRQFIRQLGTTGLAGSMAGGLSARERGAGVSIADGAHGVVPLDGAWQFRLDPQRTGAKDGWNLPEIAATGWSRVAVPHTWQISQVSAAYMGIAWYRRTFEAPRWWDTRAIRIEFEGVYHSARVWLNGRLVGEHLRKGYTAFVLDLSPALLPGATNVLAVEVDNSFDQRMLPRGESFDWTPDGGLVRPINLLVTSKTYIERVDVDAEPDLATSAARLDVLCALKNSSMQAASVDLEFNVLEQDTGRAVLQRVAAQKLSLKPGESRNVTVAAAGFPNARLWHFDRPNLYRLVASLTEQGRLLHECETTFGVRRVEVREGGFYLNGERMWLMGVERMAGSHPDFGMAEPFWLITHDHDDMKELNCVFTRVHWQQDKRVLDYCDRKGMLIQVEVPTWGPDTFKGMKEEPGPEIMQNALDQLREMINRDRNHPSIFAWGLCNEIGGQNPPAYQFAKRLYEEAKRLDPRRLRSYASNSLQKNPDQDVAGLMDFIEWNEYYESWFGGTVESIKRNLEEIHRAFPDKMIVVSEYGYCECTPDRLAGDPRRIEILRRHTDAYRECEWVGGAIFFCYNDYRTHIGDKGIGALKQRVHGVVDLYGERKPSFTALRAESSPVETLDVQVKGSEVDVVVKTRKRLPAYRLDGYGVRCIAYGFQDLPMEQQEKALPATAPGGQARVRFTLVEKNVRRVRVDILRPTGSSVISSIPIPNRAGWRRIS